MQPSRISTWDATRSCGAVAIVHGEAPFVAISYLEPIGAWDSGFALYSMPADEVDDHELELVCMHCLVDEHPKLGQGLDLAREVGVLVLQGGEWLPEAELWVE